MYRSYVWGECKPRLTQYVESITSKSKGENMYICPLCGSGEGSNGTGAFSIKDGTTWHCFSCGEGGDIFDLYGKVNGVQDRNEQLKGVADFCGVTIDNTPNAQGKPHEWKKPSTEQAGFDFMPLYENARAHLKETDYYRKRGISEEAAEFFKLGYIPNWKNPNAPAQVPTSPRLIIPISAYSYTARDTRAQLTEEQDNYKKSKAKAKEGVTWTFNARALKVAESPVFIVEGEIDAISIMEAFRQAGFEDWNARAVAIGSTAFVKRFLREIEELMCYNCTMEK